MISLSNGSMLKLRNVRHVPKLKKNLIFIGQLVDGGMKITFDGDVCKITKGAMVMAHDEKEGTLYMILGVWGINFSCFIGVGCRNVASETWAHEREGNEGYALQG